MEDAAAAQAVTDAATATTIQLPALPRPPAKEMRGPTEWSNWVIPGRVIAGAFPASQCDADTDATLLRLLSLGVNAFVCLQAEVSLHVPDHLWRAGRALRPYPRDAQRLLTAAAQQQQQQQPSQQQHQMPARLDFLHLPIPDGGVTTDGAMHRLAEDCCARVLAGERLYIHCWGGHGRTGTLVAIMLGRLYGLTSAAALRYTQAYHDARAHPQGVRSPQTPVQRAQVRRLLSVPSAAARAMAARGAVVVHAVAAAAAATDAAAVVAAAEDAGGEECDAESKVGQQQQPQQQQEQQQQRLTVASPPSQSSPGGLLLRARRSPSPSAKAVGARSPAPSPYVAPARPHSSSNSTGSAAARRSTISAARSRSVSPTAAAGGAVPMARAASASPAACADRSGGNAPRRRC